MDTMFALAETNGHRHFILFLHIGIINNEQMVDHLIIIVNKYWHLLIINYSYIDNLYFMQNLVQSLFLL